MTDFEQVQASLREWGADFLVYEGEDNKAIWDAGAAQMWFFLANGAVKAVVGI